MYICFYSPLRHSLSLRTKPLLFKLNPPHASVDSDRILPQRFLNVLQLEVIYLPSESLGSYVLFLHGLCVILRNKQFMFLEVLRTLRVAELELSIRLSYTSDFRAEFKDCLSSFSALCDQNS